TSMGWCGVLFLSFLARPFEAELGETGAIIRRRTRSIAFWSTLGLILAEGVTLGLQGSGRAGTVGLVGVVGAASSAPTSWARGAAAASPPALRAGRAARTPAALLLAVIVVILVAAT